MKSKYILFKRAGVYYAEDTATGKQASLRTKDEGEALTLLNAKNEAGRNAGMNLQLAQVYLQHSDPALAGRTWQHVMETIASMKTGPTRERWEYAIQDKAFDAIRQRKLLQTTSEHFLAVLKAGTVATNVFLRRAHNFAIGMHWLPWPVLPKLQWPAVQYKEKRAITAEEHQKITQREKNPELRAFYELLWHLGASQPAKRLLRIPLRHPDNLGTFGPCVAVGVQRHAANLHRRQPLDKVLRAVALMQARQPREQSAGFGQGGQNRRRLLPKGDDNRHAGLAAAE